MDEIERFIGKKRLSIIENCREVFCLFNDCGYSIDIMVSDLTKYDERLKKAEETKNTDWESTANSDYGIVSFALGYVLGLSFEAADPSIREKAEKLKRILRANEIPSIYPREKAA